MRSLQPLYHLARADFFERIRRPSFIIVLAITTLAGYLFVPPVDAGYRVLQIGTQRGIYNSPWIGLMFGLVAAMHLPLFGFYLVKNAVTRDRQTKVGQIIASNPLTKPLYIVGKWLSNLAVLILILVILTMMAIVMQLVRAEEATINLRALIVPIWLMGLPMLAITASIAVLFECVPFLQGGLGNVIYFFMWLATIGIVLTGAVDADTGRAEITRDPYGYTRQLVDIQGQVLAEVPDAEVGSSFINAGRGIESTFVWGGISWSGRMILERLMWAGLALVIVMLSAVPFDRFDPARSKERVKREGVLNRLQKRVGSLRPDAFLHRKPYDAGIQKISSVVDLTPITTTPKLWRFFGLLVAELKLMLRGRNALWYVGALGLVIGCLVTPLEQVWRYLLLVVLLWPIGLWSGMGNHERRNQTDQIIFSAPHPLRRQLSATWMAGFLIAFITTGCIAFRLNASGRSDATIAWLVGAIFIPSLALMLGVWSSGSRLFEFTYILWWYLGPVEGVPVFDFLGVTQEVVLTGVPIYYLFASVLFIVVAIFGRRRYFN
jgi:hypothetical protein